MRALAQFCLLICTIAAAYGYEYDYNCSCPSAGKRKLQIVCDNYGDQHLNLCLYRCARKQAEAEGRRLSIVQYGECSSSDSKPLPCPCPDIYNPVCGSDGSTYGNDCELNCARDRQDENLKVVKSGDCDILPEIDDADSTSY